MQFQHKFEPELLCHLEIENNRLFLADFYGETMIWKTGMEVKEYGLNDLFPNHTKVFADWFSGELIIQMGKMVNYVHSGWGPNFECSTALSIVCGHVVDLGMFIE